MPCAMFTACALHLSDTPSVRRVRILSRLDIIRLAELEGLSGHGKSVALRLQKIRRARRARAAAREAEAELAL